MMKLTHFPQNTTVNPTTAWLRSGLIVFSALDQNIYSVCENGEDVRKLVNVPSDRCGIDPNTFAVSPDERKIAFEIDNGNESQMRDPVPYGLPIFALAACNAF